MDFKSAYELPIGKYVEKKGKFSYLSWAYAVRFLRENFPQAEWEVHENDNGIPMFSVGESHFVKVTVENDGLQFTSWLPILDYQNNPIKEPNAFHINTSIQRCLTKAIGLATGLGLALYAGEDLPTDEKMISDEQLIELREICESADFRDKNGEAVDVGKSLDALARNVYKVASIKDLPETMFTDAIDKISKKAAERNGTADK